MKKRKRKAIDQARIYLVKSDSKLFPQFQGFKSKVHQDHNHQNRCICARSFNRRVQNAPFPVGFLLDSCCSVFAQNQAEPTPTPFATMSPFGPKSFFSDNLSMKNIE